MTSTPMRLAFDVQGTDLDAARQCEADVFLEAFGNTSAEFDVEYGRYAATSRLMAVLDTDGEAVAACRIITPGPAGLKSLNDLAREPWRIDGLRSARAARIDPARTWDIATIAVRRRKGIGGLCAAALYYGIAAGARANGIEWLVMIMDERARRVLTATGLTSHVLPGAQPGPYLGSASSTPLFGNVLTMLDVQRRLNPEASRLVAEGGGFGPIALPRADEWRLKVPATVAVTEPSTERAVALV